MATWKKMVAESSAGNIAQNAATATAVAGGADNKVLYQTGSGVTAFLAAGSANQVLKNTGSAPAWSNFLTVSDSEGTPNTTAINPAGTITFAGVSAETTVIESSGTITIGLPDDVTVTGDLTVTGNDIKSSGGTTAVSLSSANVAIAGDLTVTGNDIKSSGGTTAISMSGADVTIAGGLTVSGTTTTIDSTTIAVADKLIKLADVATPTETTANGAGLQVESSATEAEWPELKWDKDGALSGWTLSDHTATSAPDYNVQMVEHAAGAPASGDNTSGVGSLYYDTTNDEMYLRTA
jgi:uncharacterized protein (DUF2141 family)